MAFAGAERALPRSFPTRTPFDEEDARGDDFAFFPFKGDAGGTSVLGTVVTAVLLLPLLLLFMAVVGEDVLDGLWAALSPLVPRRHAKTNRSQAPLLLPCAAATRISIR